MKLYIDHAEITITADRCVNCGRLNADNWILARVEDVQIGEIKKQINLYLCEECAGAKEVGYGEKIERGVTEIAIRNRTKLLLQFSFAGENITYPVLPFETVTLQGDYDKLEVGGYGVLPFYIAAQPRIDGSGIDVFVKDKKVARDAKSGVSLQR